MARDEAEGPDEGWLGRPADGDLALDPSDFRGVARGARNSAEVQPVLGQVHARPVRKSNVRVSKPKTPRARTPSTLALRRGGQNSIPPGRPDALVDFRTAPDDDVWPKRRSQSQSRGPVPSIPDARLTSLSKTFQEPARVADKPTEVHVRFGSNCMS